MWWSIAGVMFGIAVIVIVELPTLRMANRARERWWFAVLLAVGAGLYIALCLEVSLPSPAGWIITVYKPLGVALFGS
ncbi:conserved hypothetical protein [Paenibacillus curdlanolyticus YK9]|uniref:Uncharacterized protein n=1 Tax=Paenibacillus curdlanolyticus YK9 TaxID=717606 RepID=E0I8B0_9BACL|nr:hypothetical protein [Paenibacillus curdlanolyticus]EFM11415.1 conserved hypothetical protein [Paenibacillus curdlanolyticus YK9]